MARKNKHKVWKPKRKSFTPDMKIVLINEGLYNRGFDDVSKLFVTLGLRLRRKIMSFSIPLIEVDFERE